MKPATPCRPLKSPFSPTARSGEFPSPALRGSVFETAHNLPAFRVSFLAHRPKWWALLKCRVADGPGSRVFYPGPRSPGLGSRILDPGSRTPDPRSRITDPGPLLSDPGPRTPRPGLRPRPLDPGPRFTDSGFWITDLGSWAPCARSRVAVPVLWATDPDSRIPDR